MTNDVNISRTLKWECLFLCYETSAILSIVIQILFLYINNFIWRTCIWKNIYFKVLRGGTHTACFTQDALCKLVLQFIGFKFFPICFTSQGIQILESWPFASAGAICLCCVAGREDFTSTTWTLTLISTSPKPLKPNDINLSASHSVFLCERPEKNAQTFLFS